LPERIPDVPRVFVSYSWDDDAHKAWILDFATRLQGESGIQVILDRWHLHPGQERLHFMEQAVSTSDFVIVVATPNYKYRADNRLGGVGYESGAISAELADSFTIDKFIPVLRNGSFQDSTPIYLKGRVGVDLSGEPYKESEYEQLIRTIYGEPFRPPALGKRPDFTKVVSASADFPLHTMWVLDNDQQVQRPNGLSYARYDKQGKWITAVVRLWDLEKGPRYSFETFEGDKQTDEVFVDTKEQVLSRFIAYHRGMLKDGYKRMVFTPGPDPDFNVLR
jgi:hypothetical protein